MRDSLRNVHCERKPMRLHERLSELFADVMNDHLQDRLINAASVFLDLRTADTHPRRTLGLSTALFEKADKLCGVVGSHENCGLA